MKSYCFIFVFLLACVGAGAQDWSTKDMKSWAEGPLVAEDFSRRNSPDSIISAFRWDYKYSLEKQKIGNLRFDVCKCSLYMDKLFSWYDPVKGVVDFRYFQTIFDIAELERRKMQNEINKDPSRFREVAEYYKRSAESRIDTLVCETEGGENRTVLDKYASEVSGDLSGYVKEPVHSPSFEKNSGYGIAMGYIGECFTGRLSEGVAMSNNFDFSFFLPIRHFDAFINLSAGSGELLKDGFYHDNGQNYHWIKGKGVSASNISFMGGYRIIDKDYIALSPVVGLGSGKLSQSTDIKEKSGSYYTSSCKGFRMLAGARLSYKFFRHYGITSDTYSDCCTNFIVYGAYTDFKGIGGSFSLNFGVSLSFEGGFTDRK